ncbi:hypothetical protein [Halocatena halophila]|uniref:hypothetical protein n=1 Tax=Halocatena halophila TaxID=2814576 RepID=UPI002ED5BD0E
MGASVRLRAIQLAVLGYGILETWLGVRVAMGGHSPATWVPRVVLGILLVMLVVAPQLMEHQFEAQPNATAIGVGELTFGAVCALWTLAGGWMLSLGWTRPMGVIKWYTAFGVVGTLVTALAYYRRGRTREPTRP